MDHNVVAFTGQKNTRQMGAMRTRPGKVVSLTAWKKTAHVLRTANGVFFHTVTPCPSGDAA